MYSVRRTKDSARLNHNRRDCFDICHDTASSPLVCAFWALAKRIQYKLGSDFIAHGIKSHYLQQVINESINEFLSHHKGINCRHRSRRCTERGSDDMERHLSRVRRLTPRDPDIWPDRVRFDPERLHPGQIHRRVCTFRFG